MKKIRVTTKQYKTLSLAYRITGFFIILGLLFGYSILIGKPIEFILIFIPYFVTKGFYARQWHASSLKQCLLLSLGIFAFITTVTLPSEFSITFAAAIGLLAAYISYRAGVVQFKLRDYAYIEPRYNALIAPQPFDTETATESELIDRCRALHFSDENTELAVEFFIRKTPHKVLADRLFVEEKSITTRKRRMKAKLNS